MGGIANRLQPRQVNGSSPDPYFMAGQLIRWSALAGGTPELLARWGAAAALLITNLGESLRSASLPLSARCPGLVLRSLATAEVQLEELHIKPISKAVRAIRSFAEVEGTGPQHDAAGRAHFIERLSFSEWPHSRATAIA